MSFSLSEVDIVNHALVELGAQTISSLSASAPQAVASNAIYNHTRRELLRKSAWNFALVKIELGQSTDVPIFDYQYKYALPSDCLRVWKVYGDSDFKVVGGYIESNLSSCKLEYVKDETDPNRWDSLFTQLMMASIKAKLTYNLTKSTSAKAEAYNELARLLKEAKFIDSSEDIQDDYAKYDNALVNARLYDEGTW